MGAKKNHPRHRKRRRTKKRRDGRRVGRKRLKGQLAAILVALGLIGIAASFDQPPRHPNDLCAIFDQNRSWYKATKRSHKKWGTPEAVQLAVIRQESSFQAGARPPRRRFLWIFPGSRPSSAFGYGQVLDATWESYRISTDQSGAQRHRFADVADFIGWYGQQIHQQTGIAKNDAYGLYLAYHEGPGGFLRGNHRSKSWLLDTARRVDHWARRYQQQYDICREDLDRWWKF